MKTALAPSRTRGRLIFFPAYLMKFFDFRYALATAWAL